MRQNVLITGASSGIGAEMARQLARRGHHLALAARRTDRLDALAAELTKAHPVTVSTHALDVDDHDRVFEVFREASSRLGGIDQMIVNAGLGKGGRIGTGRFEANRDTIGTNVLGALAQCEAAMEHFYERESGHLVLVSSMSALRAMPGTMTAYAASKAALLMIGDGIRADLSRRRDHDIAVTTLLPGYIASEMHDRNEAQPRLMVDTATGVAAMLGAIDKEVAHAEVPGWPWKPIGAVMRFAPDAVMRRLT